MKFLILLGMLCLPLSSFSAELIRTHITQNGLPLTLTVDKNEIVRVDGIPIPGLTILYDLGTSTLYVNATGQKKTYAVPFGTYSMNIPEARVSAGENVQEYRGTPSRFWQLQVRGETCAHVFANTKAATESQLDMAHLSRIHTALGYVFGPAPTTPCGPYLVPKAHGIVMGLPMHSIRANGGVAVTDTIEKIEGPINTLPVQRVDQLTAEAHVYFLKSMLPAHVQAVFEANSNHLPWRQQAKALKKLLAQFALTGEVE